MPKFIPRFLLKAALFCALCSFFELGADTPSFESELNHYSGNAIQTIRVLGERCSGTTYVTGLLTKNFSNYSVVASKKHFMPWFDLTEFNIPKKTQEEQKLNFLERPTSNCLVVLVVRDPYDWLRSFYEHPWHVSGDKMLNKGFLHFIQHEWRPTDKDFDYVGVDHWNPYDDRRFSNVLELRKYKTLNYLQIGSLSENFLIVRYEEVAKDPVSFISFVSENFNMQSNYDFKNIISYKNEGKKAFHKAEYDPFSIKELIFINKSVNLDVERLIGYDVVTNLRKINER